MPQVKVEESLAPLSRAIQVAEMDLDTCKMAVDRSEGSYKDACQVGLNGATRHLKMLRSLEDQWEKLPRGTMVTIPDTWI